MPNLKFNQLLRDLICQRMTNFSRNTCSDSALTQAAVVIGVSALPNSDNAGIILTLRSSKLRNHPGQFALPGGKLDAGESLIEASLRELREELGLFESDNSVLGLLDDMPTRSGFNITPVVVWIDNLDKLNPNPDEVAQVYQIPLTELKSIDLDLSREDTDQDTHRDADKSSVSESDVMSLNLASIGTAIYSPTAAIIYQFREVALLGKSTRVAHFGQPRFTWR